MSAVKNEVVTERQGKSLIVTRTFDAPREMVFRVWTEPEHVRHWWGPDGFTNTISEMDVRPGGVWRLMMHGPDGTDYPNKIVFTEVEKPARLVYTHSGDEGPGETRFEVTVTFEERDGKTILTMRSQFKTVEELDKVITNYGALEGAIQMMGRLDQYLAGM